LAGLGVTIAGGIALHVGALWFAADAASAGGCAGSLNVSCAIAGTVGGAGLIALAIGIPMMVIGGESVPAESTHARQWWQPASVALGPTGARVGWTF
jgi:hypothetical protein